MRGGARVWLVTSSKCLKLEIGRESKFDMEITKITTTGLARGWLTTSSKI